MEEDKEGDLEILKNYQKKEAQGIKKIFIIIFILVASGTRIPSAGEKSLLKVILDYIC